MSRNILKSLREAANLSQRDLAAKAGTYRTKVFKLEQAADLPTDETELFAKALADTIDLSYVAGLFDRASSFTITKISPMKLHKHQHSPAYIARINFHSRHKLLVDTLMHVFGVGKVCPVKTKGKIFGWSYYAHNHNVDTVLEKLLPYLRLKRGKALVMQEFRQLLEASIKEYRTQAKPIGAFVLPEQDLKSTKLLSLRQFSDRYWVSVQAVAQWLKDGSLQAQKLRSKRFPAGVWAIYPFSGNFRPERKGEVLAADILDKYENLRLQLKDA